MHPESLKEVEAVRGDTILVGYYHSHPGLSVFQSPTDVKNFMQYHSEPYQIAIVVDPTRANPNRLDDTTSGWIGFFVWDKHHHPVKLSPGSVRIVDERPVVTQIQEREEKPEPERQTQPLGGVEIEIARSMWQASDLLTQGAHRFMQVLPIILLSREVRDPLTQTRASNMPNEGLLVGTAGQVAGYDFVYVTKLFPMTLNDLGRVAVDKPSGSEGAAQTGTVSTVRTELYSRGANPIGIFCSESRLSQIDFSRRRLNLFPGEKVRMGDFARHCGAYCLIGVMKAAALGDESLQISFRAFRNQDENTVDIPASQIVIQ